MGAWIWVWGGRLAILVGICNSRSRKIAIKTNHKIKIEKYLDTIRQTTANNNNNRNKSNLAKINTIKIPKALNL